MEKQVYDFIISEETNFKVNRIPVTGSKDWNMYEHIDRCTNVANGWFHKGKDDGLRPYKNIVMPIINVARRSEGFDVKDIEPYVNDPDLYYKSFIVRKYHERWARKYSIDTFIDEMVESLIVYDLALIKSVNQERPEVVKLQELAFCDQTDILSGAICLKHNYSVADILNFKGKWIDDKIDEAIIMSKAEKKVKEANDRVAKTPGKYIEVYELHGMFPETWLDPAGNPDNYTKQVHIVSFYTSEDDKKNGITLFKGKNTKETFKAKVLQPVYGRACGLSIVEQLFEPQMWTNYSEIKIKALLDAAALLLLQTEDDNFKDRNDIASLKTASVLTHKQGMPISQINIVPQNYGDFVNHQKDLENNARVIGSANEAQLGISPTSGTPFKLQDLVVSEGQGYHEWRQGIISTFMSEMYRDWILQYLVDDINKGKRFLEELSMDELQELTRAVAENASEEMARKKILEGKVVTTEDRALFKKTFMETFIAKGNTRFLELIKGELNDIPVDVYVNIKGKQKNMAKNADALTKLLMVIMKDPKVFQDTGLGKVFNELMENSGFSPVDFSTLTRSEQPIEVKNTVTPNNPNPTPSPMPMNPNIPQVASGQ